MDAAGAIERNRAALKRVLASLMAMAGFADAPDESAGASAARRAMILPRRLHRAVLAILRPAESAARRLIIAASRGVVVAPPARRRAKPLTGPTPQALQAERIAAMRRLGLAVAPSDLNAVAAGKKGKAGKARKQGVTLSLFDPLRRVIRKPRARTVPAHAGPRISIPGLTPRFRLPPPPGPNDPIDATRLRLRLLALGAALDDLPGQARRFARWQAAQDNKRDAAGAQEEQPVAAGAQAEQSASPPRRVRFQRLSPLRLGKPPGGRRVPVISPATGKPRVRKVDEILAEAHSLAFHALEMDWRERACAS